jgi:hypothetical protein
MIDEGTNAYLLSLEVDQLREDSNDVFTFLLLDSVENLTELFNTLSYLQR